MLVKFKSVRELIEHICEENPQAANDDRILYGAYWKHQDPTLDDDTIDKLLKLTTAETITRGRRDLEERGIIKVSPEARMKRTERMNIVQNHYLTEKEQEELSKKPTNYVEYQRPDGTWIMKALEPQDHNPGAGLK